MKTIPNELTKNFADPACRRQLMKCYGTSKTSYHGSNEHGEAVLISISTKSIQVTTYQNNGWVRIDEYDERGFKESERFEGRWLTKDQKNEAPATKKSHAFSTSVRRAAEALNPNYSKRHNDIVFASDICKAVLNNTSLPTDIREKLVSAIETLDSIAR